MDQRTQQLIAIAGLIALVAGAIWLAISFKDNTVIVSIATGIIGSIFAGLVYTIFSNVIFGGSLHGDDVARIVQDLNARLISLERTGVDHLADRKHFDDEFWQKAIIDAGRNPKSTSELILFGRTLDKWARASFKTHFSTTILAIIRNGGRVEILSLMPNSPAAEFLTAASAKNMTVLSKGFDEFLDEEIFSQLNESERTRIIRRYISDLQLTFNLFKSDNLLWISPYLSTRDTGTNIALTIKPKSTLAELIMDDYQEMKRRHSINGQKPSCSNSTESNLEVGQ